MEKILKTLNELGYDVLFIDETNQIFIVNRFESPIQEGLGDVGFAYIEGIEITSILPSIPATEHKMAMRSRLETAIQDNPVLKMKFSSGYRWRLYVA